MTVEVGIRSASVGGSHCLAPSRSVDAPVDGAAGRYERLFGELEPLGGDDEALLALGAAGGLCDGGENCDDAIETAAGWPLFGQFVAHDITADRSPLAHGAELSDAVNFRSPRANLECLYGSGQIGSPFLYRRDDPALLLLGRNDRGKEADLPRNSEGVALVGDPRNDVHLFVSQLHVAMIGAHNRLAERERERRTPAGEVFETARRETACERGSSRTNPPPLGSLPVETRAYSHDCERLGEWSTASPARIRGGSSRQEGLPPYPDPPAYCLAVQARGTIAGCRW